MTYCWLRCPDEEPWQVLCERDTSSTMSKLSSPPGIVDPVTQLPTGPAGGGRAVPEAATGHALTEDNHLTTFYSELE